MSLLRALRPSPALVIACLALLVSLGGVGYAAVTLPKNSVGTLQLKKNAVTPAKIRNHAVTATKINLKGLTVPNARHADSADNAATLAGLTPTALAGTQRQLLFAAGTATTIAPYTCIFIFSYGVGAPADAGKVVGMWITDQGGTNPPPDLDNRTAFIPGTVALTSQGGTIAFAQVCNLKSTPDSLPSGWKVKATVH